MAESQLTSVTVVKVHSPSHYGIKELEGERFERFLELTEKMKAFYETMSSAEALSLHPGLIYVALHERTWKRVKYIASVQRPTGLNAKCYLLDYGKEELVPKQNVRKAEEEFLLVPYLVADFIIDGIQPKSLTVEADLSISSDKPRKEWDASAFTFVTNLLKGGGRCHISVAHRDQKQGRLYGQLFVSHGQTKSVCVGKLLLEGDFACPISPASLFAEDTAVALGKIAAGVEADHTISSSCSNSSLNHSDLEGSIGNKSCSLSPGSHVMDQSYLSENSSTRTAYSGGLSTTHSSTHSSPRTSMGRGMLLDFISQKSGSETSIQSSRVGSPRESGVGLQKSRTLSPSNVDGNPQEGNYAVRHDSSPRQPSHVDSTPVLLTRRLPRCASKSTAVISSSENCTTNQTVAVGATGNSAVLTLANDVSGKTRLPAVAYSKSSATESIKATSSEHCGDDRYCRKQSSEPKKAAVVDDHDMEVYLDISSSSKMPSPYLSLVDFTYRDILRRSPNTCEITQPTQLQMYTWRIVSSLEHDVIGIGKPNAGKTLSYLVPLVGMLEGEDLYRHLPRFGIGPRALILTPSWLSAQRIFDQCRRLVSHNKSSVKRLTPFLMYGAGAADDKDIEVGLINGCDILISTPDCLLRMMEKKAARLSRLCHLILEEADILCEHFSLQLTDIIGQYQLVKNDRTESSVPEQVLFFARHWNDHIVKFSDQIQSKPVVIVGPRMEASYYGRVRQLPELCDKEDRDSKVLSIITSEQRAKILVCTSTDSQCKRLFQVVGKVPCKCMMLNGQMEEYYLKQTIEQWNSLSYHDSEAHVLVVSDEILDQVRLNNASVVIHYDLPGEQTLFANRLWCCRMYFSQLNKASQPQGNCRSIMLLPNDDLNQLLKVCRPLQRSNVRLPEEIYKLLVEQKRLKELRDSQPLCFAFKCFGYCRLGHRCNNRHYVASVLDSPIIYQNQRQLPTEGTVKVRVTHVKNAVCYYVNILKHTSSDDVVTTWDLVKAVEMDVGLHYCKSKNAILCDKLARGQMYAYKNTQHTYHRVQVKQLPKVDEGEKADHALVFFVDTGAESVVSIKSLYVLPPNLAAIPPQAVEVIACRLKPVDSDVEWTDTANKYIAENIDGKQLEGQIVLSLNATLWLDPLVERQWFPNLKTWKEVLSVRSLLRSKAYADENVKHLELLFKACEGSDLVLPAGCIQNTGYTAHGQLLLTETAKFPESDDRVPVFVSAIESPDHFYCQLSQNKTELDALNDGINQHVKTNDSKRNFDVKEGLLVIAKHPCDDRWYRGKIVAVELHSSPRQVDVFFVDYGESEYVKLSDVQPLPAAFHGVPFQAVECCLIDIECVGDEWDDTFDKIVTPMGQKLLHAEVCRKSKAQFSGRYRYGIRLYDQTAAEYDVSIESYMVSLGCARLTSTRLSELFQSEDKGDDTRLMKVLAVCRCIVECQDTNATDCEEALTELQRFACDKDERRGLINALFQVLEYCWQPDVIRRLLEILLALTKGNLCNCDEYREESNDLRNRWDILCQIMELFCSSNLSVKPVLNAELLKPLLRFLMQMVVICQRCAVCFANCGGLRIVGQLMIDFADQPTMVLTLLNLADEVVRYLSENRCLLAEYHYAVKLLTTENNDVKSRCIKIIKQLTESSSIMANVTEISDVFTIICQQIVNWSSRKLVLEGARLLRYLIIEGIVNKKTALDSEVLSVVESLRRSSTMKPSDELRNCLLMIDRHIRQMLADDIPSKESSARLAALAAQPVRNKPITLKNTGVITESRRPIVYWSQSANSIVLRIDVKEARETPDMLRTTEDTVQFRTVVGTIRYKFNLLLHAQITFHEISVSASSVYVGLHKRERGIWRQLLKKHKKAWYIKVDHDLWASDCEDEADEDGSDAESPLRLVSRSARRTASSAHRCWGDAPDVSSTEESWKLCPPEEYSSASESSSTEDSGSDFELEPCHDPSLREDKELGFRTVSDF